MSTAARRALSALVAAALAAAPGVALAHQSIPVGEYTLHITGQLEGAAIDQRVTPEEVQTADTVEFPPAPAAAGGRLGLSGWLGLAGIVLGLLGTALGAMALMNRK